MLIKSDFIPDGKADTRARKRARFLLNSNVEPFVLSGIFPPFPSATKVFPSLYRDQLAQSYGQRSAQWKAMPLVHFAFLETQALSILVRLAPALLGLFPSRFMRGHLLNDSP